MDNVIHIGPTGPHQKAQPKPVDIGERVRQYVWLRDQKEKAKKEYLKKVADLDECLEAVAGHLFKFIETHKLENLKTEYGTCYIYSRTTASLQDPEAFMKYVIDNQRWDLMDRRANATACKEFADEHKTLPPGCKLTTLSDVGVRRPQD